MYLPGTSLGISSSVEAKDESSEFGEELKDSEETASGSTPIKREARTAQETSEVDRIGSSELRAAWVKQRCLTLRSKMYINGMPHIRH